MYCIEGGSFCSTQEFLRPVDDIGWLRDWFIRRRNPPIQGTPLEDSVYKTWMDLWVTDHRFVVGMDDYVW